MRESLTFLKPPKTIRKPPGKPRATVPVNRSPLLLDFLPYHPYKVLEAVFKNPSQGKWLADQLSTWLNLCAFDLKNSGSTDTRHQGPKGFYDALPLLFDALGRIHEWRQQSQGNARIETPNASNVLLNKNGGNPFHFLRDFFERYPQEFVRRELARCMYAVMIYAFDNGQILPDTVMDWYEKVHSLTEAASILSLTPLSER